MAFFPKAGDTHPIKVKVEALPLRLYITGSGTPRQDPAGPCGSAVFPNSGHVASCYGLKEQKGQQGYYSGSQAKDDEQAKSDRPVWLVLLLTGLRHFDPRRRKV